MEPRDTEGHLRGKNRVHTLWVGGKRNRVRQRWAQRGFSPTELLNLWQPTGAWEEHRGLAYGKGPRQKLDVYKPYRQMSACDPKWTST